MSDLAITAATAITGANTASGDLFPVVDVSASTPKGRSITRDELGTAMVATSALTTALAAKLDKAGGTMTGVLTTSIPALGTTPNQGITLTNTTPAALGAQQVSPWLSLIGQGWNTTSSASQPAEFAFHVLPVQGTTVTQRLLLRSRVNNGSWGTCAQFYNQQDSSGITMTLNSLYGSVDFQIGGLGTLRTNLSSTGTGSFQIDNGGGSAVILTAKTTATLQLGATSPTPAAQSLTGADGTGTNVVGGKLCLAPGRSTGNATPGIIALQGTSSGSSGTSLQTLVDVLSIVRAGVVRITGIPTSSAGLSTGDIWSDAGTLKIV